MSELPVDVLSKITSYTVGEPKYLTLKRSKGLKQIQKRYKQIFRELNVDRDVDDEVLYECFTYKFKRNHRGMPVLNSIVEEVDTIKGLINGSYLRYIQPDIHCDIYICIECDVELRDMNSEEPVPYAEKSMCVDIDDISFNFDFVDDGEFNIEYTIEKLRDKLWDMVDTFCHEEYDDVVIRDVFINVDISIDNEKTETLI